MVAFASIAGLGLFTAFVLVLCIAKTPPLIAAVYGLTIAFAGLVPLVHGSPPAVTMIVAHVLALGLAIWLDSVFLPWRDSKTALRYRDALERAENLEKRLQYFEKRAGG